MAKFETEPLRELLYSRPGETIDQFKLVATEMAGERRWGYDRRIIFEAPDGRLYEATGYVATNDNGHDPFHDADTVECHEVVARTVETVVYEPKAASK